MTALGPSLQRRLDEKTAKRLATAAARTALWGGQCIATEGDDGGLLLVVSRWAMTRSFEGPGAIDAVEGWLDQVGAR